MLRPNEFQAECLGSAMILSDDNVIKCVEQSLLASGEISDAAHAFRITSEFTEQSSVD